MRWIDLGCPIDLDFDPTQPDARGFGWMCDDKRPTVTVSYPRAGPNGELNRILIGMYDYGTGLNLKSLQVVADFPLDGLAPGTNLASRFRPVSPGVWELKFARPITLLAKARLSVSVEDQQGNVSRLDRSFSVSSARSR